jgi:hypothetical protein
MALFTIGTNANNSLSSFIVGYNDTIAADIASLNAGIRDDPPGWMAGGYNPPVTNKGLINQTLTGTNRSRVNQAYTKQGWLFVPGRGNLKLQSGDIVAYDVTTGWPIVISGDCAANGAFTYTHP